MPDYKALAGDRLDNLPGVTGIGDVIATALLHEKESIEGIYKDIDSLKTIPLRGIDRIVGIISTNKEQAYLMKSSLQSFVMWRSLLIWINVLIPF